MVRQYVDEGGEHQTLVPGWSGTPQELAKSRARTAAAADAGTPIPGL